MSRGQLRACLGLTLPLVLLGPGCFDDPEPPAGSSTETSAGDGDGDPTGDGDGDPTGDGDGDGDPTGDGDGDPTGDGDGDSTGDGDGDPAGDGDGDGDGDPNLCGNGVLDAGELCDDGMNLGIEEDDCAPDCSAVVKVRKLFSSEEGHGGDLESLSGPGDLPQRVDSLCPLGYKAMFTYGGARTASLTPFVGDGQVDWVLDPWTRYERMDGTWIGTTDAAALLGVRDGAWYGLENGVTCAGLGCNSWIFTGMNPDFTTVEDPDMVCNGYTSADIQLSGFIGSGNAADLVDGQNYIGGTDWSCLGGYVYCAEQG